MTSAYRAGNWTFGGDERVAIDPRTFLDADTDLKSGSETSNETNRGLPIVKPNSVREIARWK